MGERWHPFGGPVDRHELWLIAATALVALVTPAAVGAIVKIQLDLQGKPTLSWLDGIGGIVPLTLSITVAWASFGLLCHWLLHRAAGSPRVLRAIRLAWVCGVVGGVVAIAPVLHEALQEAAYALLIAVLRPDYYWRYVLGGALAGGCIGFVAGYVIGRPDSRETLGASR
jgi:hypothetical protein